MALQPQAFYEGTHHNVLHRTLLYQDINVTFQCHSLKHCSHNGISRLQRPNNKNWHAHYSLCARIKGNLERGLAMCALLTNVASTPHSLAGLRMQYNTLTCTLHVY